MKTQREIFEMHCEALKDLGMEHPEYGDDYLTVLNSLLSLIGGLAIRVSQLESKK